MGAHTFCKEIFGVDLTPERAYAQLVEEAQFESGHDAYNGTISTTEGFIMVTVPKGVELKLAVEWILDGGLPAYEKIEKWGPAGCIELKGRALAAARRRLGKSRSRHKGYIFFGWAAS